MDSIVDRVRNTGISLGAPNFFLPARIDYKRLNKRAKDLGRVLAVVFSAKGAKDTYLSASPCDKFGTFHKIRKSPAAQSIEYFAVEESLIR